MKKIHLLASIMSIITLFSFWGYQVEADEMYNFYPVYSNATRQSLTDLDVENINLDLPGEIITNVIEDSFEDWNSSIFSPWRGTPIMAKNLLKLPRNSSVHSLPINLYGNKTYKIILGNLKGSVQFVIRDHLNGLVLLEQTMTGTGTDISFNYSHINHWPATGLSVIDICGNVDSEATSFKIYSY